MKSFSFIKSGLEALRRARSIEVYFFLLPFCLYAGRAAQAAGILLFGLLLPAIRESYQLHQRMAWRKISRILAAIYLIFPIMSIVQVAVYQLDVSSYQELWRSPISSMVLVFSCLMLFLIHKKQTSFDSTHSKAHLYSFFASGSSIALTLLGLFSLVQLITGYHFSTDAAFRPDRVMGGGFYRITGLHSHPIPFAGFALTVFSFFAAMATNSRHNQLLSRYCSTVALFLVIASGSRMACASALLISAFLIISSQLIERRTKISWLGLSLFSVVLISFATGLDARYLELTDTNHFGFLGERLAFWHTHWSIFIDHWFWGQSKFLLEHGVREAYYQVSPFNVDKHYNAHNIYLEILVQLGLFGTIILTMLSWALVRTLKMIQGNQESYHLSKAIRYSLLTVMLFGGTQNSLFDTPLTQTLLGFFCLLFWSSRLEPS